MQGTPRVMQARRAVPRAATLHGRRVAAFPYCRSKRLDAHPVRASPPPERRCGHSTPHASSSCCASRSCSTQSPSCRSIVLPPQADERTPFVHPVPPKQRCGQSTHHVGSPRHTSRSHSTLPPRCRIPVPRRKRTNAAHACNHAAEAPVQTPHTSRKFATPCPAPPFYTVAKMPQCRAVVANGRTLPMRAPRATGNADAGERALHASCKPATPYLAQPSCMVAEMQHSRTAAGAPMQESGQSAFHSSSPRHASRSRSTLPPSCRIPVPPQQADGRYPCVPHAIGASMRATPHVTQARRAVPRAAILHGRHDASSPCCRRKRLVYPVPPQADECSPCVQPRRRSADAGTPRITQVRRAVPRAAILHGRQAAVTERGYLPVHATVPSERKSGHPTSHASSPHRKAIMLCNVLDSIKRKRTTRLTEIKSCHAARLFAYFFAPSSSASM